MSTKLKKGMKGPEVALLQRALNTQLVLRGWPLLKVDEDFGTLTEKALYRLLRRATVTDTEYSQIQRFLPQLERVAANAQANRATAQKVQALIDSDRELFATGLRCLALYDKAKAAGKDTSRFNRPIIDLVNRYNKRQNTLRTRPELAAVRGYEKDQAALVARYASGQVNAIGIAPLVVAVIVVVGVLVVGTATWVLNEWLEPTYSESERDLKISRDLEKALETLSPEDRQKVEQDLEKQIDDAYNQGNDDGQTGGIMKILWPIGLVVGGFFLVDRVIAPALNKNRRAA